MFNPTAGGRSRGEFAEHSTAICHIDETDKTNKIK
jgi:hypothetical protein